MKNGISTFSRWTIILVGIPAGLFLGKTFLITFTIGSIVALVFSPVMDWLIGKGLGRGLAIALCALILLSFFGLMVGLLSYQVNLVVKDWPRIEDKASDLLAQAQGYIEDKSDLDPQEQKERVKQILSRISSSATTFFGTFTSALANFILIFVYLVLLLSHRNTIEKFIIDCVDKGRKDQAFDLMFQARKTASSYVWGMLKDIAALAVIYAIGFYFGHVKYSILLAVIAALFSFVPYVGNVIGGGLAALLAVVSGEPSSFLVVLGVMTAAQLVENYFLSPYLVGNAVGLNPLFSIVSVILMGLLWGIGGAIVAIPLMGILRVAFKFSPDTEPMVQLMGEDNAS